MSAHVLKSRSSSSSYSALSDWLTYVLGTHEPATDRFMHHPAPHRHYMQLLVNAHTYAARTITKSFSLLPKVAECDRR